MFNASLFEDVEHEVQHRHPVDEVTVWKKTWLRLEQIKSSVERIHQDVSWPIDVAQLTICSYLIDKVEDHNRKCKQNQSSLLGSKNSGFISTR